MRKLDLKGQRFGRLVAIKETDKRSGGNVIWECKCKCGNTAFIPTNSLRSGSTRSCGCLNSELIIKRSTIHSCSKRSKQTAEFKTWLYMLKRVNNKNCSQYKDYGGRGIKVCKRWYQFENFLHDMGEKPSPAHSLDRINNNGDYCPENCRWATKKQQCRNRRTTRFLTFRGETKLLIEWAEELNISYRTIYSRLRYGWSIEKALNTKLK